MAVANSSVAEITDALTPPPYRPALPRRLPERVVMAALVDATTELAYIERDEQLAADVAREIEMGGADNVPALPPLPPVEPKADDVVLHLATRRIQGGYDFGSAA